MKPGIAFVALVVVFSLAAPTARADMFQPSHYCTKPYKPFGGFDTEYALDSYLSQVKQYKQCIQDFVADQKSQARKHLAAADEAIEEWNSFVRLELP